MIRTDLSLFAALALVALLGGVPASAQSLFANWEKLQKPPFHPTWRDINLAPTAPGWTRLALAERESPLQNQSSRSGSPQSESFRQAEPAVRPFARLAVEDRHGVMNQPVRLGVVARGAVAGSYVLISRLAAGARLTAGSPVGQGCWRLSLRDLVDAEVVPATDFTGGMDLSADLRLSDDTVSDSSILRLDWAPPPPPANAAPRTSASVGLPASPTLALYRDEIDTLASRGESFLGEGDIAAARLLLQRAAAAGHARAALALGGTYDPAVLRRLGVVGNAADIAQARTWYEKAGELGVAVEARERLRQLGQHAR
jgi:hypothetical protein